MIYKEINTDHLKQNLERLRHHTKDAAIMAVVKANAYGHGVEAVAPALQDAGVRFFAVSSVDEGVVLRELGITGEILVNGAVFNDEIPWLYEHDLTCAVSSVEWAAHLADAQKGKGKREEGSERKNEIAAPLARNDSSQVCHCEQREAISLNENTITGHRPLKVHIKIDTGMGRYGISYEEALSTIEKIVQLDGLQVEGIFSHLSCAEDEDQKISQEQHQKFISLLEALKGKGISFRYQHLANSAGVLNGVSEKANMVRVGLALYGLCPGFLPVLSWSTKVAMVKTLPMGHGISYGQTFLSKQDMTIAIIPVGYSHGLDRRLSNQGHVLIKGQKAPICGTVCMDQTIVDVTHIEGVTEEDEVVLVGQQGKEEITVMDVAEQMGTIPYEVVCGLWPK